MVSVACILTKISANSGSGASCAPTAMAMAPMVPVVSMANDRAASGEFITIGKCSATRMTHSTTEAPASIVRSATICKSTGFQFGVCFFCLTTCVGLWGRAIIDVFVVCDADSQVGYGQGMYVGICVSTWIFSLLGETIH